MSGTPLTAKIVQTKFRRFRANVVGATKDFMYVIPILFPEGPDWDDLHAAKIQIEEVEVEIKPYYNFATLAGADKGVVSGDYPVYMNFYTGNTAGEDESRDMSKYILSGKYVLGSATTGVKARYGAIYYKTVLDGAITDKDQSAIEDIKSKIRNKENADKTIDDFLLLSDSVILQKGRVVLCLRKDDFMMKTNEVVTETNPGTGENGNGNNGAILRHLLEKGKKAGKPETVADQPRKKGRKIQSSSGGSGGNGGNDNDPEPLDPNITYCEDPIIVEDDAGKKHWELMIDLPFWVMTTFHIKYWREA